MLKPRVPAILLFWLTKYVAFYILLMFKNKNYGLLKVYEIKNGEDLFYYLWLFLFLPVVCMIIFSAPVYFAFRMNRPIYFALITIVVLAAEYLFYTWSASQADLMNGIYNGLVSIAFLLLFFYRYIPKIVKRS
jgi:hypothetical protein